MIDNIKSDLRLTIITVVRNSVSTIEQTILSVLNQTYSPIEYILIDGVSTDGTIEKIKDIEFRIKDNQFPNFQILSVSHTNSYPLRSIFHWISEPDKGIYDAINKGIEMANGKYIGILHGDDWYEPSTCELISKEIEKDNSEIDMYYGMIRVYSIDGIHLKTYGSKMSLIINEMIAHPSCFIKQEIYRNFRYNLKYKSAADYELLLKLNALGAKFKFLEKVISNFRLGGTSDTIIGALETIKLQHMYGKYSKIEYFLKIVYLHFYYLIH